MAGCQQKCMHQFGLKFVNKSKTVFMKRSLFLTVLFFSQLCMAQRFHLGVYAGGGNYLGELNKKLYAKTKLAGGVSLNYELSDRVMLRGGLMLGKVEGADRYGNSETIKQIRNLSFQSNITEFSLLGELTAFNLYNIRWSPYAFAGIAVYHFNPFTTDSGRKVFLQPLGTEGQGLTQYPDRKPYALTQFSIPFGGGIKYNISDDVRIGLELGMRRLFTDYLDDVSKTYADESLLLAARGPEAIKYAYRGDEVPGETQGYPDVGYPAKDAQRGNPKANDWMYFTGIHLTFRLGGGYGKTSASGNKSGYGCPKVPM